MAKKTKLSIYEIITMTPYQAFDVIRKEIGKRNPNIRLIKDIFNYSLIDINYQCELSGYTLLLYATFKGQSEVIETLLEYGANPDLQDNIGFTPLMISALDNYNGIVKTLLEYGANPDLQNLSGKTVLMFAVSLRHTEMIQMILQHNTNLDLQCGLGMTALEYAKFWGEFYFYETSEIFLQYKNENCVIDTRKV
jgi:ankyrin repeat protein